MEGDALRLRPEFGDLALGDPAGQERRQLRRVEPVHRRPQGGRGQRPVPARVEHVVQDVVARGRDFHGLGEQVAVVVDHDTTGPQRIGERVVLGLRPAHPEHVIEQQIGCIVRGEALEFQVRAVQYDLPQAADLGIHVEHGTPVLHGSRSSVISRPDARLRDVDLDLSRDAAALTADLVDVPSVSGDEEVLADAIAGALAGLPHLKIRRDGNAVVARTDLGRPQRVILAGHLDTVPLAGNLPSRTEGGMLYGCGSCDMKSGVAVQLRLACQLAEPSRDVTYVFYDGEEVEAERNGLLRLVRNAPELLVGDLAVLLEPTGCVIEGGCQGTMRADVTARGARAHSARYWRGRNAIHGAGDIIDVLRSYQPREPEVDGLVYHEGLNAVGIAGGVASNVIPDECVVTVNFRFAPDRTVEQAAEHVRALFSGFDVQITDAAPGARPGLTDRAAAALLAAVGGTPRAKLGWTDVARFAGAGLPAVNYGPGDPELAHSAGEHVPLAQIAECEAKLLAWLSA